MSLFETIREYWLRFASDMQQMADVEFEDTERPFWSDHQWVQFETAGQTKFYNTYREYERAKFLKDLKR